MSPVTFEMAPAKACQSEEIGVVAVYDIAAMFDGVEEVTEEQLGCKFDELTAIAAEQPDDTRALVAVRSLVLEVRDRGYVDQAMQMAIALGAMACMHNHMQELASDVSNLIADQFIGLDDHANDGSEYDKNSTEHDQKTCKDCMAGRLCRKRH